MPPRWSISRTTRASVGCGWSTNSPVRLFERPFSPRGRWAQVGGPPVQDELRRAFTRWGLPERIRVDNGVPWGSDDGLPTEVACWLIGLGVSVTWNPPYRPQANGVVERGQGVAKQWAEPHTCATAEELQRRLDTMDRRQRDQYPHQRGVSRSQTYPELAHSGRPYDSIREEAMWDLTRLTEHLAEYAIRRKVDSQGKISVYNTQRFVGREFTGRMVWVTFDPVEVQWLVSDETGHQLRRVPAPEVSRDAVIGMRMMYRLPCRPAPRADPVARDEEQPDEAQSP
jgi:hypothetical protein